MFDATGRALSRMPDRLTAATNGVIFDGQGRVLLQKRADNGFWGLPGGVIDIGETVEQGAVREVLEETGLHVTIKRLVGIYSDPKAHCVMTYPGDVIVQGVTLAFECQVRSGELNISEESTDIGYFSVDALPEDTLISHHIRVQDALANQIAPFIR
ncbi:MAG: hypothetical protein BZY88_14275 [SAR202 cluster bacterium Io17-Chloro-G9]|nr:MAG: hypothetical protein BZY88_14275 [SAR202 cluster bacterium Io17-Chloro-G9]